MVPEQTRKIIIDRIRRDLIGPDSNDEVLKGTRLKPSDVYLTGILWPMGEQMGAADDDGGSGESEEEESSATASPVGQQRPCSMGVSFATVSGGGQHLVGVEIDFGMYVYDEEDQNEIKIPVWKRRAFHFDINIKLPDGGVAKAEKLSAENFPADVQLHVRSHKTQSGLLSTITIVNRSKSEAGNRRDIEQLTLFQVEMKIVPCSGTRIISHPSKRSDSQEEKQSQLLYRNCPVFAVGHQCSVGWGNEKAQEYASRIFSNWIPEAVVPAVRADGHEVFQPLVKEGIFNAIDLATASDVELSRRLDLLPTAYSNWIKLQHDRIEALPESMKETARDNIKSCSEVLERIRKGISKISGDKKLRTSFRLANQAMALQHSWKTKDKEGPLTWRPFQLGFVLLAAESSCYPGSKDRGILDLLWFPTGGGKTEAYLAIIAMLSFYRRLKHGNPDKGAGNAAIMRYTLRLLTAQQFERASSLILAADLIRTGIVKSDFLDVPLGAKPFSIGIWVGGEATPNNYDTARQKRGTTDGCTAEQIELCPCCSAKVLWDYDDSSQSVAPYCNSDDCILGRAYGKWPIYTVDSDIYSNKPTLLIGTIDKFALLPTRIEVSELFGLLDGQRPDLIIQDELHLISGPLGTVAGLYETALDWLFTDKEGNRPKIIGSTATIRRASDQVRNLFDRETTQFPPLGIDHDDSGFAVRDDGKPGRIYLGVTTAGRSAKFVLQAVSASLLQSAGPTAIANDADRDGYSTLLCYFNSLRELGGAIVQMLDDVPDSIALFAKRRSEKERLIKEPAELTSRVSQKEIIEMLNELKRTADDPDSVDVVLATNMVSVGVDVSRLGALVVNGQPKTRSEYIQATSRVGRSKFPGLVVAVLNAAKPRDRSHYETFPGWHGSIYRDVEATSVTPFAARARDRCLHSALVAMVRHGELSMLKNPDLSKASDKHLQNVFAEIERRVGNIDPRELTAVQNEINERLKDWDIKKPVNYLQRSKVSGLMQSADRHAQRKAAGLTVSDAWPTMNNMRSVEPSTRFKMKEEIGLAVAGVPAAAGDNTNNNQQPRWRKNNA